MHLSTSLAQLLLHVSCASQNVIVFCHHVCTLWSQLLFDHRLSHYKQTRVERFYATSLGLTVLQQGHHLMASLCLSVSIIGDYRSYQNLINNCLSCCIFSRMIKNSTKSPTLLPISIVRPTKVSTIDFVECSSDCQRHQIAQLCFGHRVGSWGMSLSSRRLCKPTHHPICADMLLCLNTCSRSTLSHHNIVPRCTDWSAYG